MCTFTSAVKLSTATSICPMECVIETASGDKLTCVTNYLTQTFTVPDTHGTFWRVSMHAPMCTYTNSPPNLELTTMSVNQHMHACIYMCMYVCSRQCTVYINTCTSTHTNKYKQWLQYGYVISPTTEGCSLQETGWLQKEAIPHRRSVHVWPIHISQRFMKTLPVGMGLRFTFCSVH